MVKSVASALAGVGGFSQPVQAGLVADTTNTHQKQDAYRDRTSMSRNAYLAPPSMSFTTLFSNLPALLNTHGLTPIILMDSYDLERLQGRVVRERGNRGVQIRGAICDALQRQGILKGIDYARYYSAEKQNRYLQQYSETLETLPDRVLQETVSDSAEIYTHCNHGDYQKPFREALGNWAVNTDKRQQIEHYRQKLSRGLGDPALWHERVFGKYIAALEVRHNADKRLGYDVVAVLGQGDREGIGRIVRSGEMGFDDEVLSVNDRSVAQIGRPTPNHTANLHDKLTDITTIARKTTGTQHDDWYLLGSELAVPLFPDLLTKIHGLNGSKWDPNTIVQETEQVLAYLEKEAADNHPAHLQYEAERLIEQTEDTAHTPDEIKTQLESAADLANYARDLRELADSGRFSPTAIFTAATITMDPNYRYNEDDVYRRAVNLQRRLRPVNVPDADIEGFRNRGGFRLGGERRNWHQRVDRQRMSIGRSHT